MNTYSRILAALLLAGASSSMAACGGSDDDEGGGKKPDAGKDAGQDSGDDEKDAEPEEDGEVSETDAGTSEAGTDGGGTDEEAPPEENACPTHSNVMSSGEYCVISGATGNEIKTDLTLKPVKGKKGYLINKGVFVGEDVGGKATKDSAKKSATLTISKGVTLYGADNLSFLLVNRGSKLVAEGSAKYPIVFTTNASEKKPGKWGGVILNGRAPSNRADANGDVVGEAGTGKYSGPDADDNSGTVKYVRIEFGGSKIDDKNELNGLALQGVGKKTTIDHLHIHANDDDGVEFFGGTVDARHVLVTAPQDDGIDWTDGWTGRLQFAVVQQWKSTNPGTGANDGAHGIEADNSDVKATATPVSEPTLSNVSLLGDPNITAAMGGSGLNLRRGTKGKLHNFLVLNYKTSCISVRGTDSAGFAGDSLALENSRVSCPVQYQPQGAAYPSHMDADPAAAAKLFDKPGNNEKPSDVDALLEDGFAQTATPNFKAKTPLLTGGKTPSDSWFEKVDFIGGVGADDWTKGEWAKITPF